MGSSSCPFITAFLSHRCGQGSEHLAQTVPAGVSFRFDAPSPTETRWAPATMSFDERLSRRLGRGPAHYAGLRCGLGALIAIAAMAAPVSSFAVDATCGELITLKTPRQATLRYALDQAAAPLLEDEPGRGPVALVLLVGSHGVLNLDALACPRYLTSSWLVRALPYFHELGFITALVDAPSDHVSEDGLAGFRIAPEHAQDIGQVVADLRSRLPNVAVWIVGTSRGAISAANAAARLTGEATPDGLVLTSALMSGQMGGTKAWVTQSVFDVPLEGILMSMLVVGHAADTCIRSPAALMNHIVMRTNGLREQVVTMTGGPGSVGPVGTVACEGKSPHGFADQEAELAVGIAKFVRGGSF